ncbi:hypothetical protein M501DRAFT_1000091 [Patellaria atrata CBS 101060]|uniref:Tail specific protease domain-containing protein n=1 Tax=Patellaria atrata CBS 101060 TaxID=1346257 RepID=A0A9P4VNM8_9PEZI|nr:hypothetical protein M501DRAFT_1000091 [Patellaria atrata CBS 101060]
MAPSKLLCLVAWASITIASPILNVRQNTTSACAKVSASAASQLATAPTATPTVPASLAYECITSVPLNISAATALIESIRPYVKWQSTTAWLKDPPEEYVEKVQGPVDLWAGLADIEANLTSGVWTQEYEFGFALYTLFQSTHDGHLVYVPDSVGKVFNWARTEPLVSVSSDGESSPQPYVYRDILTASFGNVSFTPSPIVQINGQNATTYLENWSQYGSLQDRDALYNNVFYELAVVSLGAAGAGMGTFTGGGRGRWVYPGDSTTLTFANGSSIVLHNYAKVIAPFDGITDGESLYQVLFTTPLEETVSPLAEPSTTVTPTSAPTIAPTPVAPTSTPAPGYPQPVIRQENNLIGGYYLEGEDYDDVAVLTIASFVSAIEAEISFQQTGEEFIRLAKAAGKTKLVIDVSANGGGTILQGYDVFAQLFPDIFPRGYTRFRAFESTNLIGEKFSEISGTVPRVYDSGNETLDAVNSDIVSSVFNYRTDINKKGRNFANWDEKFGPLHQKGDNFSNIIRWNLSDVLTPYNSGGIYVHNFGLGTPVAERPFAAEDIVVVTDGYCASTCTIFSQLLREQAGVQFIFMGGRPSNTGIAQAIGGVKGTNNFPWSYIQALASAVFDLSTEEEQTELENTELVEYRSNIPFYRQSVNSNINFRDGLREKDTETPTQFVYEPADCRILYTPEMTVDASAIWRAAADSTWGSESKCFAGDVGGELTVGGRVRKISSGRRSVPLRKRSIDDYPLDVFTDDRLVEERFGVMLP